MNIEATSSTKATVSTTSSQTKSANDGGTKFADELKATAQKEETAAVKKDEKEKVEPKKDEEVKKDEKSLKDEKIVKDENKVQDEKITQNELHQKEEKNIGQATVAIDGLADIVEEMSKLNRPDEFSTSEFKLSLQKDDIKIKNKLVEENGLIDNNMNIQEPKEKLTPEMNANMNFNPNGQPFSEFINPQEDKQQLKVSQKDIAEEKAILSSMEENIAIANKNMAIKDSNKTKTVVNQEGIKKVDTKTNIAVDTIVKFDSVVMDKSDVEFFANLVNGDIINMQEITNPEKSASVSKTLADLLAKSMEDNKPIRIDFDNNISVIIKISREGKISADFLPSSQVAEAYLKENLPLLRQRFDDNNIEYEELNQRKQNQNNENENRKKGRKDE